MTPDVYAALPAVERCAAFHLAYVPLAFTPAVLAAVMTGRFGMTLSVASGIVRDLVARGMLDPVRSDCPVIAWRDGRLPCATLCAMMDEAETQDWWPSFENLKHAVMLVTDDRTVYANLGPHLRMFGAVMDMMRVYVRGGRGALRADTEAVIRERGASFFCGAAYAIVERVADEPAWPDSPCDPVMKNLLLPWFDLAFLHARPVKATLAYLAPHIRICGKGKNEPLAHVYAALCVWTGWSAGLAPVRAQNRGEEFCEPYRLVLTGQLAQARKIIPDLQERRFYYDSPDDQGRVADRFLAMTVMLLTKPVRRHLFQLLDNLLSYGYPVSGAGVSLIGSYRRLIRGVQDGWQDLCEWYCARNVSAKGHADGKFSATPPLDGLKAGWIWHRLEGGREANRVEAAAAFAAASAWGAAGYLNLDGLVLSLFAGAYDAAGMQARREAVSTRGVWLLPYVEPEPVWKTFLTSLQTTLAKQRTSSKRLQHLEARRLVWGIRMEQLSRTAGCYRVWEICPYLRGENDAEDGTHDHRLGYSELAQPGIRACMTDADTSCANMVRAMGGYSTSFIPSQERMELLCKMENLEERRHVDNIYRGDRHARATPIRFERRTCEMESVVGEDGSLTLRVPEWLRGNLDEPFVVRKLSNDLYAYIPITKSVRDLVALFVRFGSAGAVTLPATGLAAAHPLLEELASTLPVAAPDEAARKDMRRVPAATTCVVRLDFAEGVLKLAVVIQPIPESPHLTVEPGVGAAERLVTGAAGAYLLVRDLTAETAQLARVAEALRACESWQGVHATWEIEDLEQALAALAAVKGLEPAVRLEWIDERRLRVTAAPKSGVALTSSRTAEEWFGVKGTFTLEDGRVLSVFEMLAAMPTRAGSYVRLSDGDYVHLTKAMTRELAALAAAGHRKGGALEVPRAALPMLDSVFGEGEDQIALPGEMAKSAAEIRAELARRPRVPRTLEAQLRPYQEDGYRWLSRLAGCGFGMCLADDMGLGKTLQVIALLLERARDGVSLVVAPASVCGNWRQEIRRFAPTLVPMLVQETPDALDTAGANTVLIASYGYLLFHEKEFTEKAWNGVVLDEAQAIKNDASKRARLVKRFRAQFRVAATGTPVENRLGELWSLFDFLNPGLLGAATSFAQRFTVDGKATPELKRLVKPLVLRRLKGDVLDDLPEKTEVTIPVMLGSAERSAYEGCRLHALATLEKGGGEEQSRISILAELTRLRRFCCHPSLVLGAGDVPSAKMEALVELLEGLHQGGHRALVFSQFTDYLALVRKVVSAHGWTHCYLDGSTPTPERERLVSAFQGGEGDFFLISLKAGGTGLNLTAANYVILLDPWWNPAVENQAADRVHRIGQKQPVTVYRLVAADTVEERVIELHKEKTALAADLLEGTSNTSFTTADLIRLFR